MLPSRLKLQLIAFFVLSAGVAANLLLLQSHRGVGRAGESRMAQIKHVGFGDTGSIGTAGERGETLGTIADVEMPDNHVDVTRAVQRELKTRGYATGTSGGAPSLVTRAAIMAFEQDHGLPLTGRPSQDLLKYILLGTGDAPPHAASSGRQSAEAKTVIRTVQTSLARLGYRPGRVNGTITPDTARAIREFEVDQALPESGRISGPLVARLLRLADDGRVALRR